MGWRDAVAGRDAGTLGSILRQRLDRRRVLIGAAAVGITSAVGGRRLRGVTAQEGPTTRAGMWIEAEREDASGGQSAVSAGAFEVDFTFYAIAPNWGDAADFAPSIEMRMSEDGQTWSDSVFVGEDARDVGRPDRDGRRFGDLIFSQGARFVRYHVTDQDGNEHALPELAFAYIDASAGPALSEFNTFMLAQAATVDPPPIISRANWGADESYRFNDNGEIWTPEYQTVEHVIVHHTDTPNLQDPLIAIRSIYYYHAVTRGWGDIGYNYLVDYLGNVYEGRVGGENVVGGHAYQYAYGSSGIAIMGSFTATEEPPAAFNGLVSIVAYVGRDLDPFGAADFKETPNLPTICGHRDVLSTSCPGDLLYEDLDTLRQRVNDVLLGGDPDFAVGDEVVVVVENLNLRDGPGFDADVLTIMPEGTPLTITDGPTIADDTGWYEVTGEDGTGWCIATAIAPNTEEPGFSAGDAVSVDTERLNLRSAPSFSGEVVAVLPFGTLADVVFGPQTADGFDWWELQTDLGLGWSIGDFLVLEEDGSPSTPTPTPSPGGDFAVGDPAVVDAERLNLRSSPILSGEIVAVMPQGTALTVTQEPVVVNGDVWYAVTSDAYGDGWCIGEFLAVPDAVGGDGIAAGDTVRVVDGSLNLREQPAIAADVVAELPDGTTLSVVGGPTAADGYQWFNVTSDSYGTGWSVVNFLQEV